MIKAGLKRLISNYLIFSINFDINKVVIIIIYIDNFLFFKLDFIKINILIFFLADQYKMKDSRFCK